MDVRAVFVLLAAVLNAVLAEVKYFEVGGEVSLRPVTPTEGISSITWKHRGNIVADYSKGSDVEYYASFKDNDRTTLDLTSGVLTLRSMTKSDEGDFTVEVNNRVQSVVYSAKEVKSLRHSKVEVVPRPLTCNHLSQKCTLSCVIANTDNTDNTDSEPFQFFWKEGDGAWMKLTKDKEIINGDEIKTFSCKISNTISEKESDPHDNPFFKLPEPPAGLVAGIVVLVILILAGVVLAGFAYKYPDKLAPCISCFARKGGEQTNGGPKAENNGVTDPLAGEGNSKDSPV